ncbi:putative methyltransferase [Trichoplax sp. H2]|uniref:Methyltransferase type 11 domain-containing protein n=1 Tax=Trichoplax adhaerens TaxID=10228 RepID=B3S042_TRIAD|nr:expressed hypothetical protein [Trichoplax adhaerens]EDV24324.1 expressed hypothetical protein [Trichoplax adhaerens]RDD44220.1 putative methyltransferase [Trichoplax sp. H2]|eukprot:XP_002113850.1 expressed hypothetical protein [Trichoplax adhaerens]
MNDIMSRYTKLFSGVDHAKAYARYRPTYPAEVYEQILQFLTGKDDRVKYDLAVDVGCGSGQSTKPLARYFTQVIGLDPSQGQIQQGNEKKENANVTLQVGSGEQLPCHSNSVDLLTCAQSFHWLDEKKFFAEADRVLKPGTGCLALYGYGNSIITNNHEVTKICHDFYQGTLKGYWSDRRWYIDNLYRHITLPYTDQMRIDTITIEGSMSLDSYIGYLSSWSAYRAYLQKNSDDPLLDVKARMLEALQRASGNDTIEYTFPIFILLGRKPGENEN